MSRMHMICVLIGTVGPRWETIWSPYLTRINKALKGCISALMVDIKHSSD